MCTKPPSIEGLRERQIPPPHVDQIAQRSLEKEIDVMIGLREA